jgi:hypothetical protein
VVAELTRTESVHPSPYAIEGVHYLLSFHDDTFEAVARTVTATRVDGVFADVLQAACRDVVH